MNDARGTIEKYFYDNWTQTQIQFEGQILDINPLDDFISLKFVPVANNQYAYDGTSTGRIEVLGDMQVFCYAKNPPKTYILADSVISFLSGKKLGIDVNIEYGQGVGSAKNMDNGFFELLISFKVKSYN